jgi:hypothetical protein
MGRKKANTVESRGGELLLQAAAYFPHRVLYDSFGDLGRLDAVFSIVHRGPQSMDFTRIGSLSRAVAFFVIGFQARYFSGYDIGS